MNRYTLYFLFASCAISSLPLAAKDLLAHTPFLTALENNWQGGKVTVQSTDTHSGSITVNGIKHTDSQDAFNVNDVETIHYRIPEAKYATTRGGWGNLYIKVYKHGAHEPIAQAELQANFTWKKNSIDTQTDIELIPRGYGNNVLTNKIPYNDNKPIYVKVIIKKDGTITMTQDN